jgi:replicative DNA helicase
VSTLLPPRLAATSGYTALAALAALRTGASPQHRSRLATGFSPLDQVLGGGVALGDLVLVGGKPGQGKTVAALQWARSMAAAGNSVVFACYEHDEVALLTRLLAAELGEAAERAGCRDQLRLDPLRAGLWGVASGTRRLEEVLGSDALLVEAEERLRSYGEHLVLVRASGSRTGVEDLARLVDEHGDRQTVLFVDYVQKVPVVPEPAEEAERVKRAVEALKELALATGVGVVAVTAADRVGLDARRLRLHHFRGSTALAYEADVALVLNEKVAVVAKAHLAYDTTRAAEFRRQVVFSVEKNRNGEAGVELEFRKDFANCRFDPRGSWVTERLWEEGTVEE